MSAGEVVGGRFEIGTIAGSGGAGTVYRGVDRVTGDAVAVKLLHDLGEDGELRFHREATLLAKLSHPHIVRYLAHGALDERRHYLVTEWLEGETLAQRLRRLRLSVAEALLFAERVADAIALAHARGVIHRDLKPANLFLEERYPGRPKVLDFGLARAIHLATRVTATGARLGTPAFMSPEQAQGARELDTRSDVFSFGAVLYASLAGHSPFADEDALGIIARVVLHEPQSIAELRSDVPAPLASLIARMLAKSPDHRPRDAGEVLALLRTLAIDQTPTPTPRTPVLTTQERRVLSSVLAEVRTSDAEETWTRDRQRSFTRELSSRLAPRGGSVERLGESAYLITFSGSTSSNEQALEAARTARELRELLPAAAIAVATGRAVIEGRIPTGEVIDWLVKEARSERAPSAIRIDELTARMIEHRFEVSATHRGWTLGAERDELEIRERLLGRPLPFVGRAKVMSILRSYLDECIDESMARAVLVTGPAGRGKSRLCRELLAAMEARHEVRILFARGEVFGARSAFGLVRQAVRRTAIDPSVRNALSPRDLASLARLAEPGPPPDGPDAAGTGDALRVAWVRWLEAEVARAPVLLVLEDFHYGDWPSMDLIDAALKRLSDAPLMVLAFARPEVRDLFPSLWAERDVQEVKLSPLPKRASYQLVRAALGEEIDDAMIGDLIARAEGNVFLLEELVRAVHEHRAGSIPDTILGVLEARISALPSEAKRVLRAASIFGARFERPALLALLGGEDAGLAVDGDLQHLVAFELIQEVKPRVATQRRFAFRHELLREAAYAMLTDEDRALGHRIGGQYLEQEGLSDPLVLAEHFDRGGEPTRAVQYYLAAADAAQLANDMNAIVERADLGIRCGANGESLARLLVLRAEAGHWRGNPKQLLEDAHAAVLLVESGSRLWFQAADHACVGCFRQSLPEEGREWSMRIFSTDPIDPAAFDARVASLARVSIVLERGGAIEPARFFREHVLDLAAKTPELELEPKSAILVEEARFLQARSIGDVETCVAAARMAIDLSERWSELRSHLFARLALSGLYHELGRTSEIRADVQRIIEDAERGGIWFVAGYARFAYASGLVQREPAVARAQAEAARAVLQRFRDRNLSSFIRVVLGRCALAEGDFALAEKELRAGLEFLDRLPSEGPVATAYLARALLGQGRSAEALEAAESALSKFVPADGTRMGESTIYCALAEALRANGRAAEAEARLEEGRVRLRARAERIRPPELRRTFLEGVPENQLLLTAGDGATSAAAV